MKLVPCTIKAAKRWVAATHRHLPGLNGGLFAAAIADQDGVRGVAVAGNGPRAWNGTGRLIITRCSTDGVGNGCSMLYGALCRAGKALGYTEAWTYTLPEEPGTSLRAAGFKDMGLTDGGEWSCPTRPRKKAIRAEPKRRWCRRLTGE